MGSGFYITHRHTIFGRNPLDEGAARRRDLCQHTTTRGIRTRNPSKRVTSDPRLRRRSHRDRQEFSCDAMERGSLAVFRNLLRFSDKKLSALRIEPLFGCLLPDPSHWQPHSLSRRRLLEVPCYCDKERGVRAGGSLGGLC